MSWNLIRLLVSNVRPSALDSFEYSKNLHNFSSYIQDYYYNDFKNLIDSDYPYSEFWDRLIAQIRLMWNEYKNSKHYIGEEE